MLADRAVSWYVQGQEWAKLKRKPTTVKEMREWIALTRSLSDRVPIYGETTKAMQSTAGPLERALDSSQRFFVKPPTTIATNADADWRTSMHLWAIERILRAVNESEPIHAALRGGTAQQVNLKPTELWPALFTSRDEYPNAADAVRFANYTEARKRVTTLDKNVKAGERDALMVHLLIGVLQQGHLNPDGTLRTLPGGPATTSK